MDSDRRSASLTRGVRIGRAAWRNAGPQSPWAVLVPYGVCTALVLALLDWEGSIVWSEIGPALALQALVALLLILSQRPGFTRNRTASVLAIVLYLVSVALIRDGAGPSAGFGPLALLPVAWASLRGRRDELALAVAGVATIYIAPALMIGAPHYPIGSWRAGLLFAVISATIGIAVVLLVRRVEALLEQLTELARTDELTGLPNRRGWQDLLKRELAIARRTGRPLTVALIDLDRFKDFNDTHGHLAGDRLLLRTAAGWQSVLRESDVLARWGGDEFVLLLPACDTALAKSLVERLRAVCPDAPFSAGLTGWDDGLGADELIAAADAALYVAKHTNRGEDYRSSAITPAALAAPPESIAR